ncbi:cytochrome c [Tardiphaga robiniae]|uniref:C-type cytochrome n=1 Tax=Tardiphaga robiniae TaxID=943830 RepID=A0A7G6TTZ4_9BRAD|nr:cytochrome c [Tardiphaga robiniae]QND70226.1 c-type cytochrome [Tardiphaga robiniae]
MKLIRRRNLLGAAALLAVGSAVAIWLVRGPGPLAFAGGEVALEDYKSGDPSGVPASLSDASLVVRGKYLADAADCVACHTSQGGKSYAGGLAIKLPFGVLYSTNITPDMETGIGNYSDRDFIDAVQRGIRHDRARLYPAMPFTSYTYMTDRDVLAVKAFLFSLPPVRAAPRHNSLLFPFDQRWAMALWSRLFARDDRFQPNATRDLEWNRGAYLAEALAHCGECHTPRNLAMALNNRQKFGGAVTAGWRAFNITSDKNAGIGAWRDEDIVSYLSTGSGSAHGTASGPMGEAVDHSFSKLAPEDIRALVAFLRSVPPITSPGVPAASAAPDSHKAGAIGSDHSGKKIFEGACVSCHGWSGISPVSPFATLTGSGAVNDPSATNVAQIVIFGTKRLTPNRVLSMPAFGSIYSDGEIAAVVNYTTARFGNKAANVTSGDINRLRQQASE